MNPITKAVTAYQQGRLKELDRGHPRATGSAWWWTPAGAMRQISDVRDGSANSITQASLIALTDAFSEAPVQVVEEVGEGQEEEVPNHPLPDLIARPNPYMTSDLLWHYYMWSTRIDGNAYLYKSRSAAGAVVELWPLRPDLVTPHADDDPMGFIDYFSYRPRGIEQKIPPEEIVHLRIGLDPTDHRKGYGPIKSVLKEVLSDEEASRFATSLLTNMAIPGVMLSPAEGEIGPDEEQATAIKEDFIESFGKDKRGAPVVSTGPLKPHIISFSPEQMDFKTLRRVPEERITAVLRVPAIIAGMGSGLEATSGQAESNTLLKFFTQTTVVSDWRRVGRQLTWNLLPDFNPTPNQRVEFDTGSVVALQESQGDVWDRADKAVRSGWLTVGEGKRLVGIEPKESDEVYLRAISLEEVPVDEGMRVPVEGNGAGRVEELADA
jgi:HK97 family phage portal protein